MVRFLRYFTLAFLLNLLFIIILFGAGCSAVNNVDRGMVRSGEGGVSRLNSSVFVEGMDSSWRAVSRADVSVDFLVDAFERAYGADFVIMPGSSGLGLSESQALVGNVVGVFDDHTVVVRLWFDGNSGLIHDDFYSVFIAEYGPEALKELMPGWVLRGDSFSFVDVSVVCPADLVDLCSGDFSQYYTGNIPFEFFNSVKSNNGDLNRNAVNEFFVVNDEPVEFFVRYTAGDNVVPFSTFYEVEEFFERHSIMWAQLDYVRTGDVFVLSYENVVNGAVYVFEFEVQCGKVTNTKISW